MEWQEGERGKAPRLVVPCPECGQPMVVRVNRTTQEPFYGCATWPRCTTTQPLSDYHQKLLRGDPRLPGF